MEKRKKRGRPRKILINLNTEYFFLYLVNQYFPLPLYIRREMIKLKFEILPETKTKNFSWAQGKYVINRDNFFKAISTKMALKIFFESQDGFFDQVSLFSFDKGACKIIKK